MKPIVNRHNETLADAPFFVALFNNPWASLLWLPLRLWLGWQWIQASLHKITEPAWVGGGGEALKGFWMKAVAIPETGKPMISYDWYRSFLQAMLDAQAYTWFAKLVAYGELIVGIALIIGAFTGLAAFFGALMNWNFMMAGSASVNPMFFVIALGLLLAWKVSGLIGLDYYLLRFAVPWRGRPLAKQ